MSVARAGDPVVEVVRSLLAGRVGLEDPVVRRTLELMCVREERRAHSCLPREEEGPRSDAGQMVVARLTTGDVGGLGARDVASAYLYAYRSCLGREDLEAGSLSAWRTSCASALLLIRREFAGRADEACRYVVRVVRFWKLRMDEGRWPGPGAPTFGRMRDARLVSAWRKGEVNAALGIE